jgi:hypothetical protein
MLVRKALPVTAVALFAAAVLLARSVEAGSPPRLPDRSEAVVAGAVVHTEPFMYLLDFPHGFDRISTVVVAVDRPEGGVRHLRVLCVGLRQSGLCRHLAPGSRVTLNGYLASNVVIASGPEGIDAVTLDLAILATKVRPRS